MLSARPGRNVTLVVTGMLAGSAAAGCSKEADRAGNVETASSTPRTRALTDTGGPGPDTTAAASPSIPSPVAPAPAAKPDSTRVPATLPKPSIDPGRKSTAPGLKPGKVARPSTDSTSPSADPSASAAAQNQWLKYDAGSNTATFELIAGPFTFNGYRDGQATLVVPPKANVVMNFVNKDGTPHSAIIISGDGPIPNSAGEPAIPRAYTNKALEGLPQEASDVMRFTVPESGSYRIFCGVPGHGLSGMWLWMRVDPAAKTPSFGPTKA